MNVVYRRALVANVRGLMAGGQEAIREILNPARRHIGVAQHYVAGEIRVGRAETVSDPRTEAREAADVFARVKKHVPARVQRKFGLHGANDRQVVNVARDVREQRRDRRAALPVTLELPQRPQPFAIRAGDVALQLGRLAVKLG